MTDQELVNEVIADFDREVKQLTNEGHVPDTFPFVLAKLAYGKELGKRFGITVNWNIDSWRGVVVRFLIIFNLNWLFVAKILLRIWDLKNLFRPSTIHTIDGLKFLCSWRDRESRYIFEDYICKDSWEPETTKLVKQTLKEGEVVVDVGASIGPFTMQFARIVGDKGRVYAFEPAKRCFKYLKKNIKLNGFKNVEVFPYGAWDKTEVLGMPRCDVRSRKVLCVSLDEFLEERGILKVDYLKMDIDGSEPWALKGLERTFKRNPQMRVICEYYPKYILNAGGDPKDVISILSKYFNLGKIEGDYGDGCVNLFCTPK